MILASVPSRHDPLNAYAPVRPRIPHAVMSAAAHTLKQQKEDFVSNLSGGSVGEINVVTSIAPVSIFFFVPEPPYRTLSPPVDFQLQGLIERERDR